MILNTFEIKVALLGYVSVGKTTVLNALFRDKFSEVSAARTTAGINFFRCVRQGTGTTEGTNAGPTGEQWSPVSDGATKNAPEVLQEIEKSNKLLREASVIEEKYFNIELEHALCEMREDTDLVIVEIPGLNEADSSSIYMNYVNENWGSFDCVVAVMDARQGVNTEEQVELLKLIKKNLSIKKKIPVIILFNKVDDPEDEDQALLLEEARNKVSEVFSVGNRAESLQKVLEDPKMPPSDFPSEMYPIFIPTSAVHAFFYRTASLLTIDKFREKFDMSLIERIGREEMGKFKWKKLSEEEKYQAVFEAVCEDDSYEERLAATNFDKFLKVLSLSVGGKEVQTELLLNQLNLEIQELSPKSASAEHVRSIYERARTLGEDTAALTKAFWAMFRSSRDSALAAFEKEYKLKRLAEPMTLLCNFYTCIRSLGWEDEEKTLKTEARKLVRWQLGTIIKKQNLSDYDEFLGRGQRSAFCHGCKKPVANSKSWNSLSLHDWLSIFESVLLMSCNQSFCESFGREKIAISQLRHKFITFSSSKCRCELCDGGVLDCTSCGKGFIAPHTCPKVLDNWSVGFENGCLEFDNGATGTKNFIVVPALLSDEKHFGYLAWKCCKLLEAIDNGKPLV